MDKKSRERIEDKSGSFYCQNLGNKSRRMPRNVGRNKRQQRLFLVRRDAAQFRQY